MAMSRTPPLERAAMAPDQGIGVFVLLFEWVPLLGGGRLNLVWEQVTALETASPAQDARAYPRGMLSTWVEQQKSEVMERTREMAFL